jgi:hypothetical protein
VNEWPHGKVVPFAEARGGRRGRNGNMNTSDYYDRCRSQNTAISWDIGHERSVEDGSIWGLGVSSGFAHEADALLMHSGAWAY